MGLCASSTKQPANQPVAHKAMVQAGTSPRSTNLTPCQNTLTNNSPHKGSTEQQNTTSSGSTIHKTERLGYE